MASKLMTNACTVLRCYALTAIHRLPCFSRCSLIGFRVGLHASAFQAGRGVGCAHMYWLQPYRGDTLRDQCFEMAYSCLGYYSSFQTRINHLKAMVTPHPRFIQLCCPYYGATLFHNNFSLLVCSGVDWRQANFPFVNGR